jgi:hypothetical protein
MEEGPDKQKKTTPQPQREECSGERQMQASQEENSAKLLVLATGMSLAAVGRHILAA